MFTLPPFPYDYAALEPYMDRATAEIHHDKHHRAYVNNLNAAIADSPNASLSLLELVKRAGSLGTAIRNNAGGHFNHTFLWESLTPSSSGKPTGSLYSDLTQTFGSFEKFKEIFSKAAIGRFASGWAWLVYTNGKLAVSSTPNQDNPLMNVAEIQGIPLLSVDVWEHAYYLKYQNRRADYLNEFWNIVNWDVVAQRYSQAKKA